MSERLPYEEQLTQQWDDLPLPDENMAWADMKKRLEKDDDDGLVPAWLRGCALWGIIGVLLIGLSWWILKPGKWFDQKKNTPQKELVTENPSKQKEKNQPVPVEKEKENLTQRKNSIPENIQPGIDGDENKKFTRLDESTSKLPVKNKKIITRKNGIVEEKITGNDQTVVKDDMEEKNEPVIPSQKNDSVGMTKTTAINPPANPQKNIDLAKNDTTIKKNADSIEQKKITGITKTPGSKKDSSTKKQLWFSIGVSMNQQLPISGQKLTPYNAEGRKGSLADYIPSVYVRMYKNDKWFIQSEFRYGAPQYNKEILYNQKIQTDTFNVTRTTTSANLKKTFYHQLPVSFNYFITKNWSVGAGLAWNKFVSAISSQDIIRHNYQTGNDSIIAKGKIISTKQADSLGFIASDTNFIKSYFQGIFETQYRWKRFSIGARYSFGLQPYLKFTLPGGVQQQERNNSLNLFLRYELWRSKK